MAWFSVAVLRKMPSSPGYGAELPSRTAARRRTASRSSALSLTMGSCVSAPARVSERSPLATMGTMGVITPVGDIQEPPKRGPYSGCTLVCSAR